MNIDSGACLGLRTYARASYQGKPLFVDFSVGNSTQSHLARGKNEFMCCFVLSGTLGIYFSCVCEMTVIVLDRDLLINVCCTYIWVTKDIVQRSIFNILVHIR